MNKLILVSALFASTALFAQDAMEADADTIAELKEYCMEIAAEDGTEGMPMEMFLLTCVNEELESEGYKPLKKLP